MDPLVPSCSRHMTETAEKLNDSVITKLTQQKQLTYNTDTYYAMYKRILKIETRIKR